MSESTRRRFLVNTAAGVASTAAIASATSRAAGANKRVRVGVIGCGGQGRVHIRSLVSLDDVELVYVCDVDSDHLAKAVAESGEAKAKGVDDLRTILDDRSIDAVTIATPDHWHTPAALLAIEAGKHVYVEKPCAHNIHEGRLLLEAARKNNRVVQHGTQSRTSPGIRKAIEMLHGGAIGEVLLARCWNWQRRNDIGHGTPSAPPAGVNYERWVGPAEMVPFQANRFHYNWHWWHNFGCGGIGNDGIHELDYTLWGLGVTTNPTTIAAVGGKYYFDDDQEFPDMQQVTFEFTGEGDDVGKRRMLVYEQRLWSTNYPFNVDAGAEFFGTEGRMFLSKRGKFQILANRNRPSDVTLTETTKVSVPDHQQNWIDCIRSGERPNADIAIALRTATAVHLGNISTRVGRTLRFDLDQERVIDDNEANALFTRAYRKGGHWSIPKQV